MLKIPVIKCNSDLWETIKPLLEEWGYECMPNVSNWNQFPYLTLNIDGHFGKVGCITQPDGGNLFRYNREIVFKEEDFLNIAASLKGRIYHKYIANSFTKNDLKSGMVVETAECAQGSKRYLVCDDMLISPTHLFNLSQFNNDLNYGDAKYDIVKVFEKSNWSNGFDYGLQSGELIWERHAKKRITKQEVADVLGINIDDFIIT